MDDFIRRNVMGYPVAVGTVESVATRLADLLPDLQHPYTVAAADVHVVTRGIESPDYGEAVLSMDLICPDGVPLVKLLNRSGQSPKAERISGPDLMEAMLSLNEKGDQLKHFFLGSTERTLDLLCQNIKEKYPACIIAGTYSPPFKEWDEEELQKMARLINESQANIVWIGLGCPKQERWLHEMNPILPPSVYLTVGAAFDFHAGTVRRAPVWMQRHGLEWFYRLCKEPGRLFKRYLRYNTLFLYYLITGRKTQSSSKL